MALAKISLNGRITFLSSQAVLYLGQQAPTDLSLLVPSIGDLRSRISKAGYKFLYLPEIFSMISSDMLSYSFPGSMTSSPDFIYDQIRIGFPQTGERPGFIVNSYGRLDFYPLPAEGDITEFINDFISAITPEDSGIMFSKVSLSEELDFSMEESDLSEPDKPSLLDSIFKKKKPKTKGSGILGETDGARFRMPDDYYDPAEVEIQLDRRTEDILAEIRTIQNKYGISVDELDKILGYQVRLSRLHIWHSGKITLTDFDDVEVKMDKLSKAVYFLYLRHPEGICFKELSDYSGELLDIYSALTDKDDRASIEASIAALTDSTRNSINEKVSKIKAAFRNTVSDRIARFYYVDGISGEKRKIALDRKYVIWDE